MSEKYLTTPPLTEGMPGGVPYIVGNEAAERFSFYGMKTILFVFMTQYLLAAGGKSTSVMTPAEANETIHYFVAAAYGFSIFGAILSDVWLGKYRTIIFLSIVYCLGHLALAVDETRVGLFAGLGLIAIGAGGIKPCVSAHVGDQFGERNKNLLSRVFQWFYFAINFGAFFSTVLTPWLMARFGAKVAFGVPGVLMLLATIVFWLGRNKFVHIPPGGMNSVRRAFSGDGLRAIFNLAPIYLCVAVFWALFDQTGSSWIDQAWRMDRQFAGITWYSSQIQAANPILILLFIPLFSYVIYPLLGQFFTVTPLRKIGIGFFICVAAFAVPSWIETQMTGGQIVQFKDSPQETAMQVAPQADREYYPVENIIDGQADGEGWAAVMPAADADAKDPAVVIRLAGHQPWNIDKVALNPYTVLQGEAVEEQPQPTNPAEFVWDLLFSVKPQVNVREEQMPQCWAKEVEVLVSNARVGPWQNVGTLSLRQQDELQPLTFEPVKAEYVMLRIKSNHGGKYATLGEATVFAAGDNGTNLAATGPRPNIAWQLLAYVLLTAAEIMISITCLEFSYTQAPPEMKSFIMSIYLLSVTVGNLLTGFVNRFIQNPDGSSRWEGTSYFLFFTGLILATAFVYLAVATFYRGRTYIQGEKAS